jgi:hypothetical protein
MDDSADAKQKTVFSVSGFIGDSAKWFDVERYWNRRLQSEGLAYFRTYDCVHLEGEFKTKLVDRYGLTTARVIANAVLLDLKQIVATSELFAYCFGVWMDDYRLVASEPDGEIVLNKDPYVFAHLQAIGLVLDEVYRFPRQEIVAFQYDLHSKAELLQTGWPRFQECNPNFAKSAGTLAPVDDKNTVPIQVADLLAHTTTRTFKQLPDDPEGAQLRLKGWLTRNLMRVAYADATYLRKLVAANVKRARALGAKGGLLYAVEGT